MRRLMLIAVLALSFVAAGCTPDDSGGAGSHAPAESGARGNY